MTSLTDAMIGYITPDGQEETAPLRSELPTPVQELLLGPATGSKFRDVAEAMIGTHEFEPGTMLTAESLGLDVAEHAAADWVAVGVPVLTADELDAFVEGWTELHDDEAFLRELRVSQYWEAHRTTDGRWAILPQDRSANLTVALPLLAGYGEKIVFERVTLLQFEDAVPRRTARMERAAQCSMDGTKQLPNYPYRGSCDQRDCPAGCAPILGRASDGAKVLLACNC